ncbi:hypothetical protein JAAARDRAFT_67887 [Jaapia argillacea MUCL 33604]|uniref:Uncharacterized protein n=1 Tax=Jaapia argillacea MUCL 33604 TaxID=933084 RepID=A0A067PZT9_9AGAM|nr:hypothetical protein JAAARDRAFT_67887 [Jaapia argillacea MUCL 33604]
MISGGHDQGPSDSRLTMAPPPPLAPLTAARNSRSQLPAQSLPSPPATPPPNRGRLPSRYPLNLARDPTGGGATRVPLHRRGTSRTYETLDDLLKEAGYKETRIFTPEGEGKEGKGKSKAGVRGGVGAFVGFFAGLVRTGSTSGNVDQPSSDAAETRSEPRSRRSERDAHGRPSSHHWSPPPSPLEHRNRRSKPLRKNTRSDSIAPSSTSYSSSDYEHMRSSLPSLREPPSASSQQLQFLQQQLPHARSRPTPKLPPPSHISSALEPNPSRAKAYLRHMASAPNIPRPHTADSVPRRPSHTRQSSMVLSLNDEQVVTGSSNSRKLWGDEEPLPPSWLESVTKAVSGLGLDARVGRPYPNQSAYSATSTLSRAYSKRSRLTQSQTTLGPTPDQASLDRGRRPARELSSFLTPMLLSRAGASPGPSQGAVSTTRVICRSAPGSRDSSRSGSISRKSSGKGKGKRKGKEGVRVPSLASTKVEGDVWSERERQTRRREKEKARGKERKKIAGKHLDADIGGRYMGGWGMGGGGHNFITDDDDSHEDAAYEDESTEDEELDLARILVPPKRQHSIKSLRKHLHLDDHSRKRVGHSFAVGSPHHHVRRQPSRNWSGDVRVSGRRRRSGEYDDDGYDREEVVREGEGEEHPEWQRTFGKMRGTRGEDGSKRRGGLPGAWAQWTAGRS